MHCTINLNFSPVNTYFTPCFSRVFIYLRYPPPKNKIARDINPETIYGSPKLKVAIVPPINGPIVRASEAKDCATPKTIPCLSSVDSRDIRLWVLTFRRLNPKEENGPKI